MPGSHVITTQCMTNRWMEAKHLRIQCCRRGRHLEDCVWMIMCCVLERLAMTDRDERAMLNMIWWDACLGIMFSKVRFGLLQLLSQHFMMKPYEGSHMKHASTHARTTRTHLFSPTSLPAFCQFEFESSGQVQGLTAHTTDAVYTSIVTASVYRSNP